MILPDQRAKNKKEEQTLAYESVHKLVKGRQKVLQVK